MNHFLSWLWLFAIAIPFAGCGTVRKVSEAERAESFAPFEEAHAGSESLRNHVLRRTAFLINGTEFTESDLAGETEFSFLAKPQGDVEYGSAAAVDRRGYFVTAAHCVHDPPLGLVFVSGSGAKMREARVVYKGERISGTADFAVLHVDEKLDHAFRWETNFEPGDQVVSAGVGKDRSAGPRSPGMQFRTDPVGGRIEEVISEEREDAIHRLILHASPLEYGNSGGPLVSDRGRLLGVNTTGPAAFPAFHHPRFRFANAVRPDLKWLKRIIDEDARQR